MLEEAEFYNIPPLIKMLKDQMGFATNGSSVSFTTVKKIIYFTLIGLSKPCVSCTALPGRRTNTNVVNLVRWLEDESGGFEQALKKKVVISHYLMQLCIGSW